MSDRPAALAHPPSWVGSNLLVPDVPQYDRAARAEGLAVHDVPPAGASGVGEGGASARDCATDPCAPLAVLRHPLPSVQAALQLPFRAFPSWFMRITCDRCGKVTMLNEAHTTGRRREMPLRDLLARMRHDGCGWGRAGGRRPHGDEPDHFLS